MTRTPDGAPIGWRARVYGMVVTGTRPVAGLGTPAGADGAPEVELVDVDPAELDAAWPATGAMVVSDRGREGAPRMQIAEHLRAGWRLRADGYGAALVSRDGTRVLCAAGAVPRARWERYLLAQVLPFTAGVRGIEQLHAAAVVLRGAAVAVAAPSGAGKSTVARALLERGADLLADDVVSVTDDPKGLRAHPGPGLMSLRPPGAAGEGTMTAVPVHPDAAPLAAVWLLERGPHADRLTVERVAGDPRPLLAAAYNLVLRHPERLAAQFDLCAKIMRMADLNRIRAAPETPPEEIAAAIEAGAARPAGAP